MTAESPTPNPDQKYIAIIGDLRHSRRAKDRAGLQRRLAQAIADLNESHPNMWPVPVAMTAGDEAQALLTDAPSIELVIRTLADAARPESFTFGIGFGPVTTDIADNVALIDGPAFHNARSSLASARQNGFWAAAQGFGDDDIVITALISTMGSLRSRWTDRQLEIANAVRNSSGTQSELAARLGINPSAVSESLTASSARQYETGIRALANLFNRHLARPTP